MLELHDKIGPVEDDASAIDNSGLDGIPQGIASDALAALTSLGYSSQEVLPAIEAKAGQCQTVEELLKAVLQALGSRR